MMDAIIAYQWPGGALMQRLVECRDLLHQRTTVLEGTHRRPNRCLSVYF